MYRLLTVLVVLLQCGSGCAAAAEIDSVTPRGIALEESQTDINRIFRKRMADGVARANERAGDVEDLASDEFCDEELLYTELRKALFNTFTASWGLKGYQLDSELRVLLADKGYSLSLNDSIYRDITYLEGFSLNLKELSDVVNIGGHLVGLDKIGHMFAEGWRYFAMAREDGASLEEAMTWGRAQEEGKYGYLTTGIFSYADLVANFHGYRFWNNILKHRGDPLKSWFADWFSSAYVECSIQLVDSIRYRKIVRAWEVETSFDLADYVDGVWDEGNNCISYADPAIEAKVRARVGEVDPQFHCPFLPGECVSARSRYGRYARLLLHPVCLVAKEARP